MVGCSYTTWLIDRKAKNSQARTGHQRGMGGRWTDDDDTHERHTVTDTNKLTRHVVTTTRPSGAKVEWSVPDASVPPTG